MPSDDFRKKAIDLLGQKLKNKNLRKHCLAVEAIMRSLADYFQEDKNLWGLAGLLHDVDYEATQKDLSLHSLLAAQWLEELDFPREVVRAVKVHNEEHGSPAETKMERCLIFADAISGLVIAAALVLPSKKLADLKPESVLKRFREKDFARGVSREEILRCEKEGISLEEFAKISVEALQGIADELEL